MVNKKVVFICSVIIIFIVGAAVYYKLDEQNNIKDTYIITEKEENVQNTSVNNTIDTKQDDNLVEENNIQENENTSENSTSSETTQKSGEEKAKELAKKEWGNDDTVYYYVSEKISDVEFIISVKNKETTASLMDYLVNIETEEVEEY